MKFRKIVLRAGIDSVKGAKSKPTSHYKATLGYNNAFYFDCSRTSFGK